MCSSDTFDDVMNILTLGGYNVVKKAPDYISGKAQEKAANKQVQNMISAMPKPSPTPTPSPTPQFSPSLPDDRRDYLSKMRRGILSNIKTSASGLTGTGANLQSGIGKKKLGE